MRILIFKHQTRIRKIAEACNVLIPCSSNQITKKRNICKRVLAESDVVIWQWTVSTKRPRMIYKKLETFFFLFISKLGVVGVSVAKPYRRPSHRYEGWSWVVSPSGIHCPPCDVSICFSQATLAAVFLRMLLVPQETGITLKRFGVSKYY